MELSVAHERWPLRQAFTISRGSRTAADVVSVTLQAQGITGRGECLPYARYGETVESVMAQIEALRGELAAGMSREQLQQRLPAGAARNALDCAFWDWQCKRSGQSIWQLTGSGTRTICKRPIRCRWIRQRRCSRRRGKTPGVPC